LKQYVFNRDGIDIESSPQPQELVKESPKEFNILNTLKPTMRKLD